MLIGLFIDNKMLLDIIEISSLINKELGKYFCFFVLINIYYSFEIYILKDIKAIDNKNDYKSLLKRYKNDINIKDILINKLR